ncbi:MAG: M48 family metallopeptidase [candidate division Zixibacteria bacterium]|nr:M48 family metallopeptidase [candidate division Zixibacteria bacterium]MDH3939265.1 M48 family metallopeptidase [candidate division Zixibacteria bacterium]
MNPLRFRVSAILFALMLAVLLSCATTGPGGKTSFIVIPTSQEVGIGAGMAEQVEASDTILDDQVWQDYITEVGNKVVAVCDRQDIEYHFKVIQSDQVNAFAAPGGYIYFYTGLLREMDSEAEMAAVMAHEISHVVARHGVKRLQSALGVAIAYELAFGGEGAGEAMDAAIGIGMGLLFADYSRGAEREADNFGIQYMVKAGYNPQGALGMFETLARLGGGGSSNVFEGLARSHPETQERIANANAQIVAMQPLPAGLTMNKSRYHQMLKRFPPKQ